MHTHGHGRQARRRHRREHPPLRARACADESKRTIRIAPARWTPAHHHARLLFAVGAWTHTHRPKQHPPGSVCAYTMKLLLWIFPSFAVSPPLARISLTCATRKHTRQLSAHERAAQQRIRRAGCACVRSRAREAPSRKSRSRGGGG